MCVTSVFAKHHEIPSFGNSRRCRQCHQLFIPRQPLTPESKSARAGRVLAESTGRATIFSEPRGPRGVLPNVQPAPGVNAGPSSTITR